MTLGEQLGLSVYRYQKTGVWAVPSRQLARATAHEHSNIMGAARLAEQELGVEGVLIWGEWFPRGKQRGFPCCWIPREILLQMRLHNVPGCRIVRDIIAEYARLLEMHEAAQPAHDPVVIPAEPAPDTAIAPPDPEPAETLKPAPPWQVSVRITDAVELLGKTDAPRDAVEIIKRWDVDRRWEALRGQARSWSDVAALSNSGRLP